MMSENIMVRIDGRSFHCDTQGCGCNVFHRPKADEPYLYECNGCGARYRGEPKQVST